MGKRNPRLKCGSELSAGPTWISRTNTHQRMSTLHSNTGVLVPPPCLGNSQHSLETACLQISAAKGPEGDAAGGCQLTVCPWDRFSLETEIWGMFRRDSQRRLGQERSLCPKAIPIVTPVHCWKYCGFPKPQNYTFWKLHI